MVFDRDRQKIVEEDVLSMSVYCGSPPCEGRLFVLPRECVELLPHFDEVEPISEDEFLAKGGEQIPAEEGAESI